MSGEVIVAVLPCAGGCGQSVVVAVNDWDEFDASGAFLFEGSQGKANYFASELVSLLRRYGAAVKQDNCEVNHAHEN